MNEKFFITTPIYYVNDVPHIGHTCTTVAADIIARYHRLLGDNVFSLTGTDEHGAKVAQAAKEKNLSPQEFCDQVSQNFQNIWPKLNIQNDFFIRTTNPEHKKIVQELIQKIYDKGDIYKDVYEGLYCIGCEKFILENELVNGKCPLHPNLEPQKQSEENYFFKLKKYVPLLIKAIEDPADPNHYKISPVSKKEEVLSKLKAGVNDLSISRANVTWGIPIPWDQSQTIYVWFDALINYYSAAKITAKEDFWPASLHLVAKDILWFHTVIWEAMLLSAELPLPKEVFAHSFYTIDGQKMSKSLGNVISPEQLLEKFGADGARYLIAASFPNENDNDVGWSKFTEKYNADLANGLGNLVARVAKLCQTIPQNYTVKPLNYVFDKPNLPEVSFKDYEIKYLNSLNKLDLVNALAAVWEEIKSLDREIGETKPWEFDKDPNRQGVIKVFLLDVVIRIKAIAKYLEPFIPETAIKIEEQFAGPEITAQTPLFPRI